MSEDQVRILDDKLDALAIQFASLQTSFNWFRGTMVGIYVTIIAPLGISFLSSKW